MTGVWKGRTGAGGEIGAVEGLVCGGATTEVGKGRTGAGAGAGDGSGPGTPRVSAPLCPLRAPQARRRRATPASPVHADTRRSDRLLTAPTPARDLTGGGRIGRHAPVPALTGGPRNGPRNTDDPWGLWSVKGKGRESF